VIFLRRNFVVVCCIFVVVAVTVGAQWRRIGNSSPEPDAALARDMLAAHNEIRARVNVPPLRWSDRLAARAQEWAIHLLRERQFYHRPNPVFGENLFEITGGRAWPTDVVGDWASESREYSYRSNTCHGGGMRRRSRHRPRSLGLQLRPAWQLDRRASLLGRGAAALL
jgi:Cysteine-rich secretory protein family